MVVRFNRQDRVQEDALSALDEVEPLRKRQNRVSLPDTMIVPAVSPLSQLWFVVYAAPMLSRGTVAIGQDPRRRPLPAWTCFMANVATSLAATDRPRLTVGLTLPARGFAGVIAAAAFVLWRDRLDPMSPGELDSHLETLRATAPGSAIKYHASGKMWDGRLIGFEQVDDEENLCIETAPKRMQRKLPLDFALNVHLTGETSTKAVSPRGPLDGCSGRFRAVRRARDGGAPSSPGAPRGTRGASPARGP